MKLIEIQLTKNYKLGLPQFSNITIGVTNRYEVGEGEEVDYTTAWETINSQIRTQIGEQTLPFTKEIEKDAYQKAVSYAKTSYGKRNT